MRLKANLAKNEAQSIDISPLIDMTFILLIFFMVSSTFVKDMKLDLERPNAQSSERASTKAIRVAIDASGETFMDGKQIRIWSLQGAIRDQLANSTEKSVLVISDGKVPADKLIEVVDQCRLAGATQVGVATEAI